MMSRCLIEGAIGDGSLWKIANSKINGIKRYNEMAKENRPL